MALVVLLRGMNVGGHRTFRPAALAKRLAHLGAVNIGAAGTFVIRRRVSKANLRAEILDNLPFDAEIAIFAGREILDLLSTEHFGKGTPPDAVRFVSVLCGRPHATPAMPMTFPSTGEWLVKVLGREGRFVFGVYHRHMKVIGYLGALDGLFGVPLITRNWNTITAIRFLLESNTR